MPSLFIKVTVTYFDDDGVRTEQDSEVVVSDRVFDGTDPIPGNPPRWGLREVHSKAKALARRVAEQARGMVPLG